ncbi:MAG: SMI1/KNR4 family protein [Fluviicola sp.]
MKEIVEKLNTLIAGRRAEFYADLQESLNDQQIDSLQEKYKIQLPQDLRELYKWKNGQDDSSYEAFVNNSTFIPLEEALEIAAEMTSMIGHDFEIENWWNEKWIPIFHNGGGDYICYDSGGVFTGKAGQIIEFWHADNDRNVISPSLESFLENLNDFYEQTDEADFDEYFEIESPENYPMRFVVE